MDLLAVENLTFTYPLCSSPAVQDVSFTVQEGEFTVLCGATGSGKSTLLRLLKRELSPKGERTGHIFYRGTSVDELSAGVSARSVGFVMQKPEQQIVTDKVWHELAFGLENMNIPQPVIARRVAEMASYFGIEAWYEKSVSELSGGQKQLLNLAAVMVMNPDILILDEPTAQLDPIAASDFIATLKKLNSDFSLTVLIVEHRLEELIPVCDRLMVMENGKLIGDGSPREVISHLKNKDELLLAMPAAVRLYHMLGSAGECPLTIREGRRFLGNGYENRVRSLPAENSISSKTPALEFSDICFRYERNLPDVVR
ncbi:MAG: ABC transporter ATP-binding protein, partial [Clostridia bacterium]|nr:ABC transporter ATP-binding protein [Clostridia bacterium]